MLHTIGMIIKIILLVLAIVLGVLLVILLGLLLIPFRYRIQVDNTESWRGRGKLSWLGILVQAKIVYENSGFFWKVYVLGIPVFPKREKTQKESHKPKVQKESGKAAEPAKEKQEEPERPEPRDELERKAAVVADESEHTERSLRKRKRRRHFSFTVWWENIKKKWKRFCAKIKQLWHTTKGWIELLQDDLTKSVFAAGKKEIFYILKKIRPRKLEGHIHYGTGDPATTGQILGMIAMVYGYFGKKFRVIPDFEEKIYDMDVTCKGRVPLGKVLLSLWRLYKNKEFRIWKRKMDRIGGSSYERKQF